MNCRFANNHADEYKHHRPCMNRSGYRATRAIFARPQTPQSWNRNATNVEYVRSIRHSSRKGRSVKSYCPENLLFIWKKNSFRFQNNVLLLRRLHKIAVAQPMFEDRVIASSHESVLFARVSLTKRIKGEETLTVCR